MLNNFLSALGLLPQGVLVFDFKDNRINYANKELLNILSISDKTEI
jgi:hypothetical protein